MNRFPPFLAALSLAACTAPATLQTYAPVVDRPGPRYAVDLEDCRALAVTAQDEYNDRLAADMAANLITGALMGAALGSAYGGQYTRSSAAYGAAAGLASTDTDLATHGPQRIVDRCLAGRGHRIVSDMGRG